MNTTFLDSDFTGINSFLENSDYSTLFILVDENTHEHCLPLFLSNLKTTLPLEIIEIEAGEEMKNIQTASMIWEILSEFKADRKALLINLGGGMITDLGGFVASTYKRGVDFIHFPTSLLGMCDASIGGKTGIDLEHLKNMVGTFTFPKHVFVYPPFLNTLPFTELRSGFAEMLKHGLINSIDHYKDLSEIEQLEVSSVTPYIESSMAIKDTIVALDFKEQNIRKTLNFGHTFGHAVESLFLKNNEPIPHGEAVAMGMIMETHLSYLEKLIQKEEHDEIIAKISRFFPKKSIAHFSENELLEQMLNDKKNHTNKINFTLLKTIGSATYNRTPDLNNIKASILFYKIHS